MSAEPRTQPIRPPVSRTPDMIRRKQVREAQRAYRSRQQSLLSSLKSRVSQLENTIDEIRQTMDSFSGQIIQSTIPPSQPKLMQTVALLCEEISTKLRYSERNDLIAEEHASYSGARSTKEDFDEKLKGLLSSEPSQPSPPSIRREKRPSLLPVVSRPDKISMKSDFWRLFLHSSNALLPPVTAAGGDPRNVSVSPLLTTNIAAADRPIEYAAKPFTQQLYHACAQSGYRYLTNLFVTDEDMWPEFGLVLQDHPRNEIISYFERVLKITPCGPIEDPRYPFISLGGAGSHFFFPPMGQQTSASSGSQELFPGLRSFQMTNGVREVASEEDWFDVRDVEGFLNNAGIRVSSDHQVHRHSFGLLAADGDTTVPGQANSNNSAIFIDEKSLIKELSRLCICLGCVPGFRRRDVENLVWQNARWISI